MKVSLLGFGTVGQGVYEMICSSSFLTAGPVLVLPQECNKDFMVTSIDEITNDNSIDAVVECMGGIETAFKFACACISSKKHFVTSNKALVAAKGLELAKLAQQNKVKFLFSAACGGAIPILHNICVAKQTDSVQSCGGILNGTTNYILSGLQSGEFDSYQAALLNAQKLGYAEADPTADVSGMDTMRKVILLCGVAFDKLPQSGYLNEGIESVNLCPRDFSPIKLVGSCGNNPDGSVYAYVEPVVCKNESVYSSVNSNYNIAYYVCKNSNLIMLMGQGAGRYPTASAVLRDLTALYQSPASMLADKCVACQADNSFIKHRYIVADQNGHRIIGPISVKEMHEDAKQIREKGGKVFFAAIEE